MKSTPPRSSWGSRMGFILATSGAAIGLGNIQRFPYITAQCGGAIFVLIYLACVLLIGLPLMLVEFSIGRKTKLNPVCAIEALKPGSVWKIAGLLGVLTAFCILSYYSVLAGWTIAYVFKTFFKLNTDLNTFSASYYTILYMIGFMGLTMFIVSRGIKKGIERYSKIFMPILLILMLLLVIKSLTLPNASEGLKFYLNPDFSEIKPSVFLLALSQAFFSLCIGEAVLITYGSYTSKKDNIVSSACYIAIFDTVIALMSGLIIFPALFSFGFEPNQGIGLTFIILPQVFQQMPFGNIFGGIFFLLLSFAALTTGIALLEMPVAYLVDSGRSTRKKAVWIVGLAALLIGIPSALSKGANVTLSNMQWDLIGQTGFLDIMDFTWGSLGMVMGGLLLAIFTGWIWGADNAVKELSQGCAKFSMIGKTWSFIIKYIAPVVIFIILLGQFFLK